MSNAEISEALGNIIAEDSIRAIRRGHSWSHRTGIRRPGLKPTPPVGQGRKKKAIKSTSEGHPLYAVTMDINTSIKMRLRAVLRERKISDRVIASTLQVSESSVQSKVYKPSHFFSMAQILIIRRVLIPDVDLVWLIGARTRSKRLQTYRIPIWLSVTNDDGWKPSEIAKETGATIKAITAMINLHKRVEGIQ